MKNLEIGQKVYLKRKTIFSADHGNDRGEHIEINTDEVLIITKTNPMTNAHYTISRIGFNDNICVTAENINVIK